MSVANRTTQVSLWMKIGFIGALAGVGGLLIDLSGFRSLGTVTMWLGWAVGAFGLVGDRVVRFRKE
jgi:hypothetical protein